MSEYVTDTHALIWHLTGALKLSDTARKAFDLADEGWNRIHVPGIILIKLVYLVEKRRIDSALFDQTIALLKREAGSYTVAPLNISVAQALKGVERDLVPDMPDRIIVATASSLGMPLISADQSIRRVQAIPVIW